MGAETLSKLWYQISRELKLHMEEQLGPSLTEGQLVVLEYLLNNKHANTKASDLIHILTTTPAAVTTLLDRMEKNELIKRRRDEKDRRIVWIIVTKKGEKEGERGMQIRHAFLQSRLDRISEHNQKLLLFLMGKIVSNEAD